MRDHPESCSEIRSHLPLYVGGDLDAPILAAVALHLKGCDACGEALRAAEAARGALAAVRDEAGPDLWPGLQQRLRIEGVLGAGDGAAASLGNGGNGVGSAKQDVSGRPANAVAAAVAAGSGTRFRSLWAGLGTVAAAAAIVGVVWLGEPPMRVAPDRVTGPAAGPVAGTAAETLVAADDLWNGVADPRHVPAGDAPRRRWPAASAAGRPVAQPTGPAVTTLSAVSLASYGDAPHGQRVAPPTPRGQRASAPEPELEPATPVRSGGLRRVGLDEEPLLAPQAVKVRVRGIPLFARPIRKAPNASQGAVSPPKH